MKQNKIRDLISSNRSYRRFYQEIPIERQVLREFVDLARLSASAGNLQSLKYILSFEKNKNEKIFPYLRWAAYYKDWPGPKEIERPSAYIIILGDTSISKQFWCDHGIAAQSILLGAVEKGLGGCMIVSVDYEGLRKSLIINPQYEILMVLALGKPKEKVIIDNVGPDGSIKYWRDKQDAHHVPKRSLDEIILE